MNKGLKHKMFGTQQNKILSQRTPALRQRKEGTNEKCAMANDAKKNDDAQ
jgi:hypothetical protein